MKINRSFSLFFLVIFCLFMSGCDLPVQQMGARERGVIFRRLPTFFGGGVSSSVANGGELVVVWPWDSIIRVDTGFIDVGLGEFEGPENSLSNFVFTRAKDGNEIALKMIVRYRIMDNPAVLAELVQKVGSSNEDIQKLVVSIARSQVRRFMNELKTSEFLQEETRYGGVAKVKNGIQEGLDGLLPGSIEIGALLLDRFEFARLLPDGSADREYQEKLDEIQRIREETEREQLRIETVKAEGEQREFVTQAYVNRLEQEALGTKKQAEVRGTAYLERKINEAQSILALGQAEVQGLVEKINALEGPGGAAILKLEIARHLEKSDPKFIVLSGEAGALDVKRTDTNDLLRQMGVFEALRDTSSKVPLEKGELYEQPSPAPRAAPTKSSVEHSSKSGKIVNPGK